jgi:hypothetical protein
LALFLHRLLEQFFKLPYRDAAISAAFGQLRSNASLNTWHQASEKLAVENLFPSFVQRCAVSYC